MNVWGAALQESSDSSASSSSEESSSEESSSEDEDAKEASTAAKVSSIPEFQLLKFLSCEFSVFMLCRVRSERKVAAAAARNLRQTQTQSRKNPHQNRR